MSKHEEIVKEAWIKASIHYTTHHFNRKDTSAERLQEEAEENWIKFSEEKDSKDLLNMIYSCMDKYHNSFTTKKNK